MHKLYELKDKLINELEDYSENGKFSKEDVEVIKYAASAVDHICNIIDGEESEYSEAMDGGMMGGGTIMGGRGGSYEGGSYARGRSYARGNRGGRGGRTGRNQYGSYAYSRAAEDISEDLKQLAEDAPDERTRRMVTELAEKLKKM